MYTYTSHNDCDNVTARVAVRQDGKFAVSLFDDDSGNQLPSLRIYMDHADAVAYADILAGITPPTGDTYIYL